MGADIDATDHVGETPLFHVRNVEIARLLVDLGAGVNAETSAGTTPLHRAFVQDHLDVARFLIERGAKVSDETTPLTCVKSAEAAQMLIDRGVSINYQAPRRRPISRNSTPDNENVHLEAVEDVGLSPLMAAASSGYADVVQLLLRLGANVDASTRWFGTALLQNLSWYKFEVARMLIEAGAECQRCGAERWEYASAEVDGTSLRPKRLRSALRGADNGGPGGVALAP